MDHTHCPANACTTARRTNVNALTRQDWQKGWPEELSFWEEWIAAAGGRWQDEFKMRVDPESTLQELFAEYLDRSSSRHRLLDVGAGPLTIINKRCKFAELEIHAVDPLADGYNHLLQKYGIDPPVKTERLDGEVLTRKYGRDFFDISYSRNAIDHAYDPLKIIAEMIEVTKEQGHVILQMGVHVGSHNQWRGLHQWDFSLRENRLLLKGQAGPEVDVTAILKGSANLVRATVENEMMTVVFCKKPRPAHARPVDFEPVSRREENLRSDTGPTLPRHEAGSTTGEGFSNLLDLGAFLEGQDGYVILKLPASFPNYRDHSDLDILCEDRDRLRRHILQVGQAYADRGFHIEVTEDGENLHVDFFAPGAERLNFRFDLIERLSYTKFGVAPEYARVVLQSARRMTAGGATVFVPGIEHDLALRFLEFVEYHQRRPDKVKHWEYIKAHYHPDFVSVVNQYTDLNVTIDQAGGALSLHVDRKSSSSTAGQQRTPAESSTFYRLSETCQIPELDAIYQKHFGRRSDGCFVEVGAFDGEYVSNTSGLADMGWTGHYIEPVPEHAERCKARHAKNARVTVSQVAIGAEPATVEINVAGPLSTISERAKRNFQSLDWAKGYFVREERVAVRQLTLNDYLEQHAVKPGFELLSVDVEGYEWEVLRNFDIEKWRPQMVVIELHDQNENYLALREDCRKIVQYFSEHEYKPVYKDSSNTIYVSAACPARKTRMDYFMIWGHGLQYTRQILDMIRRVDDFEIITIEKRDVGDIAQFVQDVYACDTVPFKHLVAKTRYLLKTKPEILFILVRNKNAQEKYFGKGAFRHIQCQLVKDVKEEIRNRFNPRAGGKRTEDHVIHASDYESQVVHVLNVLGLPSIERYTRQPSPDLDVPYHIKPFDRYAVKEVRADDLRANILGAGWVPITQTPHYSYLAGDRKAYEQYHERYLGTKLTDDHFPEAYDRMVAAFRYGDAGPGGKRSLILVRCQPDGTYRILDGVHRAAVLKHQGAVTVTVAEPDWTAQAAPDNTSVVGLIFSKDRAMQLRAALESFMLHCRDADRLNLSVLYAASDTRHRQQYERLRKMFAGVNFVEEENFQSQTLSVLGGSRYVLFLVDDNIFVKPFRIQDVTAALAQEADALGFSLRLGTNTTYCYSLDRSQAVPAFEEIGVDVLKYAWRTGECDFGYPLEVSSSVFRTADVLPLLREIAFDTPNRLEALLDKHKSRFLSLPMLLTFRESVTFCNPVNVVQHAFQNRHGVAHAYTSDELAEQFERGRAIDIEKYIGFVPRAAHQEVELCFSQEPHGHRSLSPSRVDSEPLVTVYTITYNTERYIRHAIDSVLAQDYPNIEYLIIDDGSTDNTRAIVAAYNDPRITYVHREHRNFASGMNEAIRRARGEFVLGVDADDYIDPHYVRYMVEFAAAQPDHDYYYPEILAHVDESNQRLPSSYRYRDYADSREILRCVFRDGRGVIPNPGSLKRRSLYERTGFYKEVGNVEDFVYLTENALQVRYKLVPGNPLYYYRRVEGHGNTLQYDTRHKVMAESMYNMIMASDPLVLCPDLRDVQDSAERKRAFLTRAVDIMDGLARRNHARNGSHFQRYADKIREGLATADVSTPQCRASIVPSAPQRKPQIAVLPHKNNLSFMGEILARMRATHDVRIVDCNDQEGIAEALMSADVCWIEWATDFAVRVTALPRRCKTILRLHSFEAFCSSVQQIHWENVDDLVLVSPYIRDVLKDRVPDIESKVRTHVVPNCIDLNKFRLEDRPRGKRIAFVGALRPAKNIPFLLQCFREIHAADPEYTLHVAGDLFGQELHRNELYYYIKHVEKVLGIQGCVHFYGHVQDISTWLDDKDFILSASIREGHPVNIVEGMAKGLKPVIHNYPGVRDAYPDEWIFDTARECRNIVLSARFDRREYRAYVAQRWSTEKVLPQIDALLQGSPDAKPSEDRPCAATPVAGGGHGAMSRGSAATPKVSIVTACYNAERFLVECLDSILKQTMSEWELFLVDDGSTDGTRGIIEEYARRDARIKPYYFDDNRGPYVRRNFAIERASAPFIVIHDADDIMCPEKLQRLHAAISADERLGVVGSFYRMFLDEFAGIEHCEDVTLATSQEEILEAYRNLGACDFCPHGVAIIRKRLFEEIGPYDENPFGSDSFWLAKVAEYACRSDEIALKNVPEVLMLRRMHAASQTATLPTFDSRSRRARFVAHWRGQLAEAMRGLRGDSHADLKVQLRRCVCGDFVERNAHLFEQWESEPLTDQMVNGFLARISAQFAQGQYVRCIVTCGIVERLVEGIARAVPRYDLMRGLAYFVQALPDPSRMYLEREWQAHGTPAARDFLRAHLQVDKGLYGTRADRVGIIRDAIPREGQAGLVTARDRSAQTPCPPSSEGMQLEEQKRQVLEDLEAKYRRMPDDSPVKRVVALRLSELFRRVGLTERSRKLALEVSAVRNGCDGESSNSRTGASVPGLAVPAAWERRPCADAPSVTVVTVCRNGEKFLPECLDSVLKQTLPTWELFLLDDGSTDGTRRIMEEYAGRDARIRPYFFDENKGPYVRRNFAIERANAPFIVIQDGDDLMSPVKLETLHNEISRDDSLAMVGSFYRTFLERFSGLERSDPIELPLTHDEIAERLSTWRHGISHISGIIRKSMFERIGPYDENPFASDSFWSAKLAEYARHCPDVRFKNVPAYLTLYRVHGTSQTQVLSTVDPRNRRVRYRQYCECKLREIREKAAARSTLDVAAELRACDCSDFLTRFKAQIIKWESEPVPPEVTRHLLDTVAALFNNRSYVSCVSFFNGIENMDREIPQRFLNFDMLKAMALYALGAKESSLSCLHREIENHESPAAREFLGDFFENDRAHDVQKWCAAHAGQFCLAIEEVRCGASGAFCFPAAASHKLEPRL